MTLEILCHLVQQTVNDAECPVSPIPVDSTGDNRFGRLQGYCQQSERSEAPKSEGCLSALFRRGGSVPHRIRDFEKPALV